MLRCLANPRSFFPIALICLNVSCTHTSDATLATLDWHPNLDQPAQELEEDLANAQQQQLLNYRSSNLAFLLDAKLYILFDRYLTSLPLDKRTSAVGQQRTWLDQREQARAKAYAEYEGGPLAPFAGNESFIEFTRTRIAELQTPLGVPASPTHSSN